MLDDRFQPPGFTSHTLSSVASVKDTSASMPTDTCPAMGTCRLPPMEPSSQICAKLTAQIGSGGTTPALGVTAVPATGRPSAPSVADAESARAAARQAIASGNAHMRAPAPRGAPWPCTTSRLSHPRPPACGTSGMIDLAFKP